MKRSHYSDCVFDPVLANSSSHILLCSCVTCFNRSVRIAIVRWSLQGHAHGLMNEVWSPQYCSRDDVISLGDRIASKRIFEQDDFFLLAKEWICWSITIFLVIITSLVQNPKHGFHIHLEELLQGQYFSRKHGKIWLHLNTLNPLLKVQKRRIPTTFYYAVSELAFLKQKLVVDVMKKEEGNLTSSSAHSEAKNYISSAKRTMF